MTGFLGCVGLRVEGLSWAPAPRAQWLCTPSSWVSAGQGHWSPLTTNRCHWSRALSLSSWTGLVVKLRSWAWLQKGRRPQSYGTHRGLSSFRELACRRGSQPAGSCVGVPALIKLPEGRGGHPRALQSPRAPRTPVRKGVGPSETPCFQGCLRVCVREGETVINPQLDQSRRPLSQQCLLWNEKHPHLVLASHFFPNHCPCPSLCLWPGPPSANASATVDGGGGTRWDPTSSSSLMCSCTSPAWEPRPVLLRGAGSELEQCVPATPLLGAWLPGTPLLGITKLHISAAYRVHRSFDLKRSPSVEGASTFFCDLDGISM